MKYFRDIDIEKNYDFVVCGGGMTGVSCAINASRKGLKTIIIEKQGCLGGVGTSAQVNHLLGGAYYDEYGEYHDVANSFLKEITKRLIDKGGAIDPVDINPNRHRHGWYKGLASGVIFNNELMKATLDEMCIEAKVDVLFGTDIIDIIKHKSVIKYIVVHNKSGLFAIKGKYFADTTGDADIAFLSDCPTVLGTEEDNLMAPASLEMTVDGVDGDLLEEYIIQNKAPRFRMLIKQLREKGIWTFPYDIFICVQMIDKDVYMLNTIRQVGINGVDGDAISLSMIKGRAESFKLFKIVKEYFPGFKNARIRSIAPTIGIRETRRIVGEYCLTVNDLLEGKDFDDIIAQSSYGWDLPDPKKPSYQPMEDKKRKKQLTSIPYRCMLPQGVNNLIVAGRSISVERDVLGPIRVMAPCMGMGQAAGVATAIAFDDNVDYSNINVQKLKLEINI